MILSRLFNYIASLDSALTNIGSEDGVLASTYYNKTINAINLALIELYTEFPIKQRGMTIQLYSHITEYFLHSDYAATNTTSTEIYKYITDTASNPFLDDVIHVERIFNEEGEEQILNKDNEAYSLYTPAYNIIQHPYPSSDNAIFVAYRALPKTIEYNVTPDTYEVELPVQLLNLCLLFVAHKLLESVDPALAATKLSEYITLLQQAKTRGLFLNDEAVNQKLEDLGWV